MTAEHTFLIADNQFITQVGLRWLIRQTYTDALIHEVADKRALLAARQDREGDSRPAQLQCPHHHHP